jgi:WD40 repeat protein
VIVASDDSSGAAREQRLNEVLAAYLDAVEADQDADRQEWLRRHPDLAADLAEFFANRDELALPAEPPPTSPLACPAPAVTVGNDGGPVPFGEYELLEEIARGGMGVVYRARHGGLKRVVALKMILAGHLAGSRALRRFRAEAEAAAGLDHPNIVPIYEVGERGGNPYFTMKLVEGGSLARWLADRRPAAALSWREQADRARLLATVARAVHHAHQRGVLHRDLKPGNILLRPKAEGPGPQSAGELADFEPLVTDFGLAKRVRSDGWASQSTAIVGTASYMAPEQAQVNGPALTVAADVYSLGAVLYELLTGRPPFRGDSFWDTLIQVVQEPPAPPRQLNRKVAADLERICLRCLAKAPEARYASAADLADDLESWAAGGPVSVRPPGRGERLWRWCKRNPAVALLLAAVAGLLGGGAIYSTAINVRVRAAAGRAEASAAEAAGHARREGEARAAASRALDQALAALKREQAALNEEKVQREKGRQLLVRQYVSNGLGLLDGGDPLAALSWFGEALKLEQGDPAREAPHRVRLAAALRRCPRLFRAAFHKGAVRAFCLSGDGRLLFTADADGPARLWDTVGDRAVPLRLADGERVSHAAFSPEGSLLATAHDGGGVRLWNTAGGAVGQPLRQAGTVTHLEFSHDGKHLLTAGKGRTARVWQTAGGRPASPPLEHGAEVTFAAFSPDGRLVATAGAAAAGAKAEVHVWDWASGKQVVQPLRHNLPVVQAAFSPDGRRLFTSARNHNLRCWDLLTGKPVAVRPLTNTRANTGPWFSPDGRRLLQAQGPAARAYDLGSGQPVGPPLPHGSAVVLAAFGRDGRQVVTAGWDRVVRVWDVVSGQPLTPPLRHPRRVRGAAFDGAGRLLVTACDDGTVRLWDLRSRNEAAPPLQLKSAGGVLAVGPGGRAVLAFGNQAWRVLDAAKGTPLTRPLPAGNLTRAAFSPDGQRLATADAESLRLWDVAGTNAAGRVLGPGAAVTHVLFSPDGSHVVARLAGGQLRVWDAATGAAVGGGPLPGFSPWDLPVVSPDGRRVVTLRFKQAVQVWDLAAGKPALPLLRHTAAVVHAAYSPDGRRLATACADGTVHVWDAVTAQPLAPPMAHGPGLHLVGFSLDGGRLVTAGSDGTARAWDAVTGLPLTPLLHQAEPVTAATFSPEGDRLATVGKGGTARLWDLRADGRPTAELLELARLLSGQQMHAASGSFVPFDLGDLRQSWPRLRARFPAEFGKD